MKITNLFFLVFGTLFFYACSGQDDEGSKYLRWVGDSEFDESIDDSTFQICYYEGIVKQYFNFSEGFKYKGEKSTLEKQVREQYEAVEVPESGWIRIRFVVNCKGEAGRFRVTQSDSNYKANTFDSRITDQLLSIVKSLDGWMLMPSEVEPEDYYLYLIFKIENGRLIEIMP